MYMHIIIFSVTLSSNLAQKTIDNQPHVTEEEKETHACMRQSFLHGLPSVVNVILYHIYATDRKLENKDW